MTERTVFPQPMNQAEVAFTQATGALAMAELDWFLGDATDEDVERARAAYVEAHDTLFS